MGSAWSGLGTRVKAESQRSSVNVKVLRRQEPAAFEPRQNVLGPEPEPAFPPGERRHVASFSSVNGGPRALADMGQSSLWAVHWWVQESPSQGPAQLQLGTGPCEAGGKGLSLSSQNQNRPNAQGSCQGIREACMGRGAEGSLGRRLHPAQHLSLAQPCRPRSQGALPSTTLNHTQLSHLLSSRIFQPCTDTDYWHLGQSGGTGCCPKPCWQDDQNRTLGPRSGPIVSVPRHSGREVGGPERETWAEMQRQRGPYAAG